MTISIQNLTKKYRIYKKEQGVIASIKSLFWREYSDLIAVDNINLNIEQGELVGFIGPNGAGKTTTLKILSGLLYPSSGSINVLGFKPNERKEEFLKQISLVMGQKNQLWWDLPAIETFYLNKEIYEVSDEKYKDVLSYMVEMLDLENVINKQVRKLSLGERMKCELVASLIHSPQVLFLDEPTIGLDVVMQKRIREFIRNYNKQYNATVILTSHYMDDVSEICKRIIIINHGKLIYDGQLDELIKSYAKYKVLDVVFNQKVNKEIILSKIDSSLVQEISVENEHRVIIKVSRENLSSTASEILKKFDIDDIDINEPQLEGIVEEIFTKETIS